MKQLHHKIYTAVLPAIILCLFAFGADAQTATQNYVRTRIPRTAIQTSTRLDQLTATKDSVMTTIQYIDGLGRPLQTVLQRASPAGNDVIQPFVYDSFSRDSLKYLPYSTALGTSGAYRTDAFTAVITFYNPSSGTAEGQQTSGVVKTPFPFARTGYEASPFGRVAEQGAPGMSWQFAGTPNELSVNHTLRSTTTFNDQGSFGGGITGSNMGSRQAALYTAQVNADGSRLLQRTGNTATYGSNQLSVTITRDENWKFGDGCFGTSETYTDKEGQVVLKRNYNLKTVTTLTGTTTTAEMLSTYYVYDDMGNLCFVLPPGASPDALAVISQATLDTKCYQYRYDERNRLTQKKLPGKGWEFVIYNTLDQVVFTQDANQRNRTPQIFTFSKYDAVGRVIMTGDAPYLGSTADASADAPSTASLVSLQRYMDTTRQAKWESRKVGTATGYDELSDPMSGFTAYQISYYDTYTGIPALPATYDKHTSTNYSTQTRGMVTATKVLVLNTPADYLWSVPYYDDEGKVVRTFSQHYLGGTSMLSQYNYDDVQTGYNFARQPITVVRVHYNRNTGGTAQGVILTSTDNYSYDHMGRKLRSRNILKDGSNAAQPQVTVAQSTYNEVGQLKQKGLHSLNGTTFLQNVNYRYNARGWLTNINNPTLTADGGLTNTDTNDQFGMELKYDSTATSLPQYNGNIARATVKTGNVSGTSYGVLSYDYRYDKLNRLTNAVSSGTAGKDGYQSEYVRYDQMGNIQTLGRYDKIGTARTQIDTLAYTYIGNRVDRIDDASAYAGTFGFTNGASQAAEYTYDGNGNQLKDLNKGLSSISYNMLNLPQTITKANGNTVVYVYDAAGRKLRKLFTAGSTTTIDEYINGIQYEYTGATPTIAFIQTEEGRARKSGTVYKYEYDLKDHLGNTRLTTTWDPADATQMTPLNSQHTDYYAFGYTIQSSQNVIASPKNEYLYNGKELQEETGLYDYGARLYDPVIGRWTAVDPLVEAGQESTSPYGYVFDDPIKLTDPDGRAPCCGGFSDVVDLVAGATHAYLSDITTGNLPPAQYGNSSVGAFGEKLGHVVAFGQGLSEMGSGGTGAVAGVVGAPETLGASLAIEAPSIALVAHGAFTSKNAVVGLLNGNGVLNASSAQPSNDQTPQKEPNGNSHASQKPQHGYSMRNAEGEVLEYGISGQKAKVDHTGVFKSSPRIQQKLRTKYKNQTGVTGQFEKWLNHRNESINWEQERVNDFTTENGRAPVNQKRPKPKI